MSPQVRILFQKWRIYLPIRSVIVIEVNAMVTSQPEVLNDSKEAKPVLSWSRDDHEKSKYQIQQLHYPRSGGYINTDHAKSTISFNAPGRGGGGVYKYRRKRVTSPASGYLNLARFRSLSLSNIFNWFEKQEPKKLVQWILKNLNKLYRRRTFCHIGFYIPRRSKHCPKLAWNPWIKKC